MDYSEILNIIVAAGSGSRFGSELPKQFCLLEGIPVVMHSIRRLRQALPGSRIVIVLHSDYVSFWHELCLKHNMTSPIVVTGGPTRWASVKNALDATSGITENEKIITVHDGARPLVPFQVILNVVNTCSTADGAIPAIPVTDTLRQRAFDGTTTAVNRADFFAVQTPQAFRAQKLREAYNLPYNSNFTDDASVMTAAGFSDIRLVEGHEMNLKITNPLDIDIATLYLHSIK